MFPVECLGLASWSRRLRRDNKDTRVFGQFHVGIERTHDPIHMTILSICAEDIVNPEAATAGLGS